MSDLNRKNILNLVTDGNIDDEGKLLDYLARSSKIPHELSFLENEDCIINSISTSDNINNFYDMFFGKKDYVLKQFKDQDSLLNLVLYNFAQLVDLLMDNGYSLYYINPKKVFYTNDGSLIFNWGSFGEFITNDEIRVAQKVLNGYKSFINPKVLKKGVIKIDDLDVNLGQYTFLSIIYMIVTTKEQRKHFREVKELLKSLFYISRKNKIYNFLRLNIKENISFDTTLELFNSFKKKMESNPYIEISKINMSVNVGHDTIHGIRKKGIVNQDSFFYIKMPNDKLLFMVADGVSTADIGAGDIISKKIQEYLFENQEKIKKDTDDIYIKGEDLENSFKEYLNQIIVNINLSLEDLVNHYIDPNEYSDDKAIMSSTLVMGIVYENYMITAHLGDSELIFIRDDDVNQFLTPHITAIKDLKKVFNDIDKGKFNGFVDIENIMSKKEITNALPVGIMDKNNKFIAGEDLFIENNSFYLKEGDIVIATTDGLSDSINNSNKEVDKYLLNFFATEKNMNRKLIRKLINAVDENGGGIDDITVIALSFRAK